MRRLLTVALAVVSLLGTGIASATGGSPQVRTESGVVRGTDAGRVESFLGLPYAAAPVGDLRWRLPQPAPRWSGARDATSYGDSCAALPSGNGPRSEAEDCLFLNVQRPAGARPGQRLPVYFWIHGGGLQNGSGAQHDGSLVVRRTGVIVVSINYRLGVFGFLGHPGLTAEAGASGNYGFADQQAALRWVQRNITAFGGDPRRVTIGGESAGGWSVCSHLSAPGSRGLFAAAMIQSGSCPTQTLTTTEAAGTTLAQAVGCVDVACLRAQPAGRLLDAGGSGLLLMTRGVPTLPLDPDEAVRTGQFARVPVVIGATRDEGRTFTQNFIGQTREQYEAFARSFGEDVLARYPWPAEADQFTAAYLAGAIFTDAGLALGIGGCPNLALTQAFAAHTRTYAYEFAHRTGPGLSPEPAGYVWGAGHAAELAYVWPSFDNGTPIAPTFDASERRLAADMVDSWGRFVRTGRPVAAGVTPWPTFNRTDQVLSLRAGGRSTTLTADAMATQHNCDLWPAS